MFVSGLGIRIRELESKHSTLLVWSVLEKTSREGQQAPVERERIGGSG